MRYGEVFKVIAGSPSSLWLQENEREWNAAMKRAFVAVVVVAIVLVVLGYYLKISYMPGYGWDFFFDRKPLEDSLIGEFLEMVRELWRKK